jgi:hypothetical protein
MNQKLIDISIRRGRLIERIAYQRAALGRDMQPICGVLRTADHTIARVRTATNFLKKHPGLVLAAAALLASLKPRRVWRWAKRGFVVWRTWKTLRKQLATLGLRATS